ncbi:MAG: orotidine-5'-phosphate decarboxylase [Candidatus Altiarchaeales archaeon]|nr:orotidine-5'-phosphate decarboxylase [Candidatus Altiarchaeales archaeon]
MGFIDEYVRARDEKSSVLCVGLDPALPDQRRSDVIKKQYPGDLGDVLMQFSMEVVDSVQENCCAVKINSQYMLFALSYNKLESLNQLIHSYGLLSILDHKLGDIGSTNDSAFYWAQKCGFDAITFSPYAGNIREATDMAHHRELGIIVLDLMSNPEAEGFQKKTRFNQTPLFVRVAEDVKSARSDGVVVGATSHIREVDIQKIRKSVGDDTIMLFPGVGSQGGDAKKILQNAGKNIIINVGRNIIYNDNPGRAAQQYNERMQVR